MLKENIQNVLLETSKSNSFGEKITIVGASKTMPYDVINDAINYGLTTVAENKVSEFLEKKDLVKGATWHFIGHLQSNKAKYLVGSVDLIHSVDTIKLAEVINKLATNRGITQNILLEVNVSKEESKSGFYLEDLKVALDYISNLSGVNVKGLMTMLPLNADESDKVKYFTKMREVYEEYKEKYDFCYLSMGMSNDYKVAIKCGSNMIRLGTKIFGKRNYGENNGII